MADLIYKLQYNGRTLTYPGWNGYLAYEYVEPPKVYEYMTFKCAQSYNGSFDVAYYCEKYYTDSYMKNLDNNTTASMDGRDSMLWNVTAGTTYMCYWAESDITRTKNYSPSNFNNYPIVYQGNGGAAAIGELYSMDFWHKPKWTNWNMYNCTKIPQMAANIHRGAELTNCSNLFKNAPITNSIEKFILAMQEACPNLSTKNGCFAGCTTAPDYEYCRTKYPSWF